MKIISWIKANRLEAFILVLILFTGAFMRLYRIDEYMTFLGDEGRDALIVNRLLTKFDPILIGPGTSIGNMYLGPIYYYLIAPSLLFANFSPVGPSVFVALLGVATIFLVWYLTRLWFPINIRRSSLQIGALVAASLYAISPIVIIYSRSSWNPNIMPFFSLLTIYSLWKIWQNSYGDMIHSNKIFRKWLLIMGISFAFVLQSHYLGLLLLPVIGIIWLFSYFKVENWKSSSFFRSGKLTKPLKSRGFIRFSILGFGIFSLLMSPLLIFDIRHNWINFMAIKKFFLERQTTISARPWSGLPKLPNIIFQSNLSLLSAKNLDAAWIFTYLFLPGFILLFLKHIFEKLKIKRIDKDLIISLLKKLEDKKIAPFFLISVWLIFAYLGLSVYKQHIYDHYFGFFFTAPFILVGAITNFIFDNMNRLIKAILVIFLIYVVYVNLSNNPLKYPPNGQMRRAIEVAAKIRKESGGQKMNLAVIAERNYEDGYQYFLEKWGLPVYDINPMKYQETLTNQLFVVCELPIEKCDPTHNPKAQIANFGWTKIEGEWNIGGVTLYRLVHVI